MSPSINKILNFKYLRCNNLKKLLQTYARHSAYDHFLNVAEHILNVCGITEVKAGNGPSLPCDMHESTCKLPVLNYTLCQAGC